MVTITAEWTISRLFLIAAYAVIGLAGCAAIIATPPSMDEQLGDWFAALWGGYVLLGAVGCLLGAITGVWLYEYVSIHLLGSAALVYAAVIASTVQGEPGRVAGALLLLAFTLLLAARWAHVHHDARHDTHPPSRSR